MVNISIPPAPLAVGSHFNYIMLILFLMLYCIFKKSVCSYCYLFKKCLMQEIFVEALSSVQLVEQLVERNTEPVTKPGQQEKRHVPFKQQENQRFRLTLVMLITSIVRLFKAVRSLLPCGQNTATQNN